ncbi:MAG: hypothetical protein RLZZ347_836 [Candidatus Parcubacteria bacterium]|jgi:hypothetical protein
MGIETVSWQEARARTTELFVGKQVEFYYDGLGDQSVFRGVIERVCWEETGEYGPFPHFRLAEVLEFNLLNKIWVPAKGGPCVQPAILRGGALPMLTNMYRIHDGILMFNSVAGQSFFIFPGADRMPSNPLRLKDGELP